MHRILAIFRKDVRHLWPQAATLAVLMALAALLDPTYRGGAGPYYGWLPSFALPLTCWLIVVSAIHEESLPGDRQYWLTRPYSRKELIAAKILFIAAFINLPLLVYHTAVYTALGIQPTDYVQALLWRQVFFTAFYILPAAALAAITRTMGKALAIALLGGAAIWVASTAYTVIARRPLALWQTPDATATVLRAALLAVGVSAIVALQYARRKTAVASALAAAVALALIAAAAYGPAYGRQSPADRNETARLSLDASTDRQSGMTPGGDPDNRTLDIPVRLDGTPAGFALDQSYLKLRIEVPGERYTMDLPQGQLHGLRDGHAWLSFVVYRRWLEQKGGEPAIVSGTAGLQLFASPMALPLPKSSAVVVPSIGVCHDSREAQGSISFTCYSPSPRTALMAGTPGDRVNWIVSPASVESSIPTASGFQPVMKFVSQVSYNDWEQIGGLKLIAARPLPPFRVTFRLSPVPLREYLVTDQR
jgi:hypothetical protein